MIDHYWAKAFANDWIASWNSHDMERILAHYTDDFEMSSPLIIERCGLPRGKLKGKLAIQEYWLPSLTLNPPLKFDLIDVFVGVAEITIYYNSIGRRLAVETLFINIEGKATHGVAQWSLGTFADS